MILVHFTKMNLILVTFILTCILPESSGYTIGNKTCPYDSQSKAINCSGLSIDRLIQFPTWAYSILTFDASTNKITELKTGTFEGLAALEFMYFYDNKLTTLMSGVFDSLIHLLELDLSNNQLTDLPKEIFNSLRNLKEFDASTNKITELKTGTFEGLAALEFMNLGANDIKVIPGSLFQPLAALKYLYFYENKLTTLMSGVFDSLINLLELDLSHNQLTDLPKEIFNSLRNLMVLDLSHNQLTDLPKEIFNSLWDLMVLYFYENKLTTLMSGVFDSLVNLLKLDLSHNQLTDLPKEIFNSLWNLKVLNLGANDITVIPGSLFQSLEALKYLHFYENKLTTLMSGVFDSLINLLELDLNSNNLTDLDAGIFYHLTKLKTLYLSENEITAYNEKLFSTLPSLVYLDLTWNCPTSLNAKIFKSLTDLRVLLLDHNHNLTNLHGFESLTLPKLKILALHHCLLKSLGNSKAFQMLTALKFFQCWMVGGIMSLFGASSSIVDEIDIGGNLLPRLEPELFQTLTDLEVLTLSGNLLTTLDYGMFDVLVNLTTLVLPTICNCSDNRLYMIPFIEKVDYKVMIYINTTDFTDKWIRMTQTCTTDLIDSPECDRPITENTTENTTADITDEDFSNWVAVLDCSLTCGIGKQVMTRSRYVPCYGSYVTQVKTLDCHGNSCNGSTVVRDNWYSRMKNSEHLKAQMKDKLDAIREELTVDKKKTTASLRRRISARDDRTSSTVMGGLAAFAVLIPFLFAICSDLCTCGTTRVADERNHVSKQRKRTRQPQVYMERASRLK